MYLPKTPLKILVKDGLQEERKCTKKEVLVIISLTSQRKLVNVGNGGEKTVQEPQYLIYGVIKESRPKQTVRQPYIMGQWN